MKCIYQSVSWQKTDGTDGTLTELIDKVNEKTIHNTTESVKKTNNSGDDPLA